MVAAAERHGELIAHLSPQRAALGEPQMMGIGGRAAANQARLFGHELDVAFVTKTARLRMRQLALVDAIGDGGRAGGFWGSLCNRQRRLKRADVRGGIE